MPSDNFVGEISLTAFNFAPKGWAFCNGQLMSISQNTALFSLLGTYYGGDGRSTFALPNLQGQAVVGQGQGPGLSDHFIGETGGEESVTLLTSEMPSHTHTTQAAGDQTSVRPAGLAPAPGGYYGTPNAATMFTNPTGGSMPHNNMQPYLVLNYIIALQGIFPPRG